MYVQIKCKYMQQVHFQKAMIKYTLKTNPLKENQQDQLRVQIMT